MARFVYIHSAIPHDEFCLLLWALGYTLAKRDDPRLERLIDRLLDDARNFEVIGENKGDC